METNGQDNARKFERPNANELRAQKQDSKRLRYLRGVFDATLRGRSKPQDARGATDDYYRTFAFDRGRDQQVNLKQPAFGKEYIDLPVGTNGKRHWTALMSAREDERHHRYKQGLPCGFWEDVIS